MELLGNNELFLYEYNDLMIDLTVQIGDHANIQILFIDLWDVGIQRTEKERCVGEEAEN